MEIDFNWNEFIYSIQGKETVPVIGNDLSFIKISKDSVSNSANFKLYKDSGTEEGDHIRINLYKYLAIKLWDLFIRKEMTLPPVLNKVTLNLLDQKISENNISNAINKEIISLTDDQVILEPYLDLIRITGFDTFITVNIDDFIDRAFKVEGRHINKSFNFSIPVPAVDPNYRNDPALPRIYNLMGNIAGYNFAITDEQSLEYVYMLQNGSDTFAKELFDAISHKNILMLGSSFPDWFMRFFIRILSKERFKGSRKAKYVACDTTMHDEELKNFLLLNDTKVIPIGSEQPQPDQEISYKDSIDFIGSIFKACIANNTAKKNEVRYKEVVFISYSWTDKPLAERLRNELEKNGLNVFFDDDELKTGDRYNQVIKKYLKDCDYFVALISQNALSDPKRYVYDKEWKSAIVLDGYKDQSYIRPYIIDQTAPTDERIPDEIRNLNIVKIADFDKLEDIVRRFIKENNLTVLTS